MGGTRPLWHCPRCGRAFANRNQPHACGPLRHVDDHFARSDPVVRATWDELLDALRECGGFTVNAQKTRIALQARMHFAGVKVARQWLDLALVLPRRVEDERFTRVTSYSPGNHVHELRLHAPDDVDRGLRAFLREAYACGMQEHVHHAPRRPLDVPPPRAARPHRYLMVLERTLAGRRDDAVAAWEDARQRARWLGDAALRTAITAAWPTRVVADKTLGRLFRLELSSGRLEIAFADRGDGRVMVRVWHHGLKSVAARENAKQRWTAALEGLRRRLQPRV